MCRMDLSSLGAPAGDAGGNGVGVMGGLTAPGLPMQTGVERASSGSRRRKLWEIPHKFHCAIVGTCFSVDDLRALMKKYASMPKNASDYLLHTAAVSACEHRGRLTDTLHKLLEKRHRLVVRQFSAAKDTNCLREFWRQSAESGTDIPGALWAAWTHPVCDEALEQEIYGDIHMIQHQVGSGTRADLKLLRETQQSNRELRVRIDAQQKELDDLRREKTVHAEQYAKSQAEVRTVLVDRDSRIACLEAQLEDLRQRIPDLKQRQALELELHDAKIRQASLIAQRRQQEREIVRLRERVHALQAEFPVATRPLPEPHAGEEWGSLDGKCVLCVGGPTRAVDGYRKVVEGQGGRFLHHDGGVEESLQRVDGALTAADIVICQAGCISHNAYWRVKETCKRTGKPCVFLKEGGVSSFDKVIRNLVVESEGEKKAAI